MEDSFDVDASRILKAKFWHPQFEDNVNDGGSSGDGALLEDLEVDVS